MASLSHEKPLQFGNTIEVSVTDSQRQIIEHPLDQSKTLQITSGPGAGKTTTLVYKVAYLIGTLGIKPEDILILSLTNRAVDNFKASLMEIFANEEMVHRLNVHTFHGFSHKLLIDTDDEFRNKEILEENGWSILKSVLNSKANKFTIQRFVKDLKKYRQINDSELEKLCARHNIPKKTGSELVKFFSDLKILTHSDILQKATEVLKSGNISLGHKITIVDEFQDIFDDLIELIGLVSSDSHLIIAGDPNQSIYGFLGSNNDTYKKLLKLKKTETIILNECFRSSPQIIRASNFLLTNESTDYVTYNLDGEKPIVNVYDVAHDEAECVALEILRIIEESNGAIRPRDIAVLTKTNLMITTFQKYLTYYGLKSYKISAQPSWLSGELFLLVEYLRILVNPLESDLAVLSTIELLPGIGPVSLRNIYNQSLEQGIPVFEIIKDHSKCQKYFSMINSALLETDFNDPKSIFQNLLNLGYNLGLQNKISKIVISEIDKIRFTDLLFEFYENLKISVQLKHQEKSNSSVAEVFLNNYMNLLPFSATANESIKLSTIHSAKGLEFPIVFMLDMKSFDFEQNDDKRLCYVGMTRARSLLYLNFVKPNAIHGIDIRKMESFDSKVSLFKNKDHFQFRSPVISQDFLVKYNPLRNSVKTFQRGLHSLRSIVK